MFGGNLVPPRRCAPRVMKHPVPKDILAPGINPGSYAHYGRDPNTDYEIQMYHYQQKKISLDKEKEEFAKKEQAKNAFVLKYDKHVTMKRFQRSVEDKVQEKLKAYEDTVEERRKRLEELLCTEERQYYYETVEKAQKGADQKMEQMKQRAEQLKAQREAERIKIVHEKRIEQYKGRCQELRPYLIKKNLMETKYSQLQQMRENEARKQADKELDRMWYELTIKEIEAKKEQEVQKMLERVNKEKELHEIWGKQIKGKELLHEEINQIAKEERLEMIKLSEQLRREEIEALDAKRRKRDKTAIEILEQIEYQKKLQAQRKKEENALDQAFSNLAQMELEREKAAVEDATEQFKKETAMYRKYLEKMEEERKLEEKKLGELLEIHRREIETKQDEAKCKIVEAKRQLQRDVMAERAEQIRYKKQEAENQLKFKEAENELLRMAFETNERLQAESDRLEHQAALQYRDDLKQQIQYNNVLRQREREELERQLAEGMKEEEKYRQIVQTMLSGEIEIGVKHPFRQALEQSDCYCPRPPK